ncbi:MAG TPA: hypothetical protein VGE02_08895 [Gemmatimonadales bacterium]
MPAWLDTLADAVGEGIDTLAQAAADGGNALDVDATIGTLMDAVVRGDSIATDAAVVALRAVAGDDEIGTLLVGKAILAGDAATIAAVVTFVADRALLTVADLLLLAFDTAEELLAPFLHLLLEAGIVGQPSAAELLDLPLLLAGTGMDRVQRCFSIVFVTLIEYARSRVWLPALMDAVMAWVTERREALVAVRVAPASPLGAMPAGRIPLPILLSGTALAAAYPGAYAFPVSGQDVLVALADAARRLGAVGDEIIAMYTRVPGVFVILLPALVLLAAAIPMHFLQWIGQDIRTLRQLDRPLRIATLPAPAEAPGEVKYMIFSDLHRDAPEDVVDPVLFDVSHFSRNQSLYLRALAWCRDEGYTVVENGDCEELWYRPRIVGDPATRAQAILQHHAPVYQLLAQLNGMGRHFRTRGNHDNWWMLAPGRTGPLDAIFGAGFPIFDALVIPGVKAMSENYLTTLDLPTGAPTLQWLMNQLPFGLTPDHYTFKVAMLVVHGHQVDFWNCDEHQFLGLAITNAVGVPADGIDAFPYYLKGIDNTGNPVVEFADEITSRTPWDNWLPDDPARRFARRVEFMEETERRLADSISFSESLAASLSYVLTAPTTFRTGAAPVDAVLARLPVPGVSILMGHTHNPQSRPYWNMDEEPFTRLPKLLRDYLRSSKTSYFNSGTGGWMENILWAIQVTAKGQPKLVYWDAHSCEPQLMSWELHEPAVDVDTPLARWRAELDAFLASIASRVKVPVVRIPPTPPIPNVQGAIAFDGAGAGGEGALGAGATVGFLNVLQRVLQDPHPELARAVVGRGLPAARLEFVVRLDALEVGGPGGGELALPVELPPVSLPEFAGQWLPYLGIGGSGWTACTDALRSRVAAFLLLTGYLYRNATLHQLGLLVHLSLEVDVPVSVRVELGERAQLSIRVGTTGGGRGTTKDRPEGPARRGGGGTKARPTRAAPLRRRAR